MRTSFFDLPHDVRFAAYDALTAIDCATYPGSAGGALGVAVAKGKFGALIETMRPFGLTLADSYLFPLGTDTPPVHLRHDSRGFSDCCWLVANFLPVAEPGQ